MTQIEYDEKLTVFLYPNNLFQKKNNLLAFCTKEIQLQLGERGDKAENTVIFICK